VADSGARSVSTESSPGAASWLLQRARRGDVRAFEQLYRDSCARVHGLCLRMTRDPAAAEDCTQETYLRAWRALPGFEGRSHFGTWLHRIAVNVVLERRRRPVPPLEPLDALDDGDAGISFDTPVEEAEIEAAIAALPDGARDVLVLCAIYGHTHTEAGEMLGVAEGTCKAQLHRARMLLRTRLQGVPT
jgi:RNA polymerase sigma-70 factor (ECF subfamily)